MWEWMTLGALRRLTGFLIAESSDKSTGNRYAARNFDSPVALALW